MGISTHVLDTSSGLPAPGVGIRLERLDGEAWRALGRGATDGDGRCTTLLSGGGVAELGMYRVRFETGEYFAAKGVRCLYPYVEIVFEVADERHFHIPLLLTANGYTTYRGS